MKHIVIMIIFSILSLTAMGQNVTLKAVNQPAASVFRSLIEQTGKNFVYSSELLTGMKVTVNAHHKPLKKVLDEIFTGTDIEYKIKKDNVVLKRKPVKTKKKQKINVTPTKLTPPVIETDITPTMLDEVVILSRLEAPTIETAEVGAKKVTAEDVRNTPVLFGEADVIKAIHTLPGITEGTEGMAGMNVHGGNADENLYMLDNVPLYQINHFAGLFSAFNTDIIRYIDFFKSSMPAKYDGRLSSFMDVRLQNGVTKGHHGSARIGLTSGAFNISGPIGNKTTYLFGMRRSWYDVITIPVFAIINKKQDEEIRFHYYFMDLNAKVTHRFSNKATGFLSVYFGDDLFEAGTKDSDNAYTSGWLDDYKNWFHWGNIVAQTGLNYRINPDLSAEFTAAYTRYFSSLKYHDIIKYKEEGLTTTSEEHAKTSNNINDWIFRGDFDWQPTASSRIRFGGNYIRHSFLPARTTRRYTLDNTSTEAKDSTWTYGANEFNAYIEDDWKISEKFRMNTSVHASLFYIDKKTKYGLSPRLSLSYRVNENIALKGTYSHTTQYVHQLTEGYLALPTDQWIPVTGKFKPQTADKIALGAYWEAGNHNFTISVEGYYKWMHNLLEYRDEYYLKPPLEIWNARLTSGKGTAKGVDVMIEKTTGEITGHISYSLAWADRTFAEKNGGITYPARFDNRHTINVVINWNISNKLQLNASWTGHSGNRFTLMPQEWETPSFGRAYVYNNDATPLQTSVNNYQLPFYHRLDLSCTVKNKRGYWTFSLYNAYNHMNTIAIRRGYRDKNEQTPTGTIWASYPVFQKVKLLPIIPSISYTWKF
ncbi:MAG: TonB-dependent receptor [Bacteroides sp.]|nr:TonB-dependent receptor [Bacteroides sp.]